MAGAPHQALATGIVIEVIELLLPEALSLNRFRMPTRLPEATLSIRDGSVTQNFQKAGGDRGGCNNR
jgi:hypothetical protein